MKLLSVIIPSYNSENYLENCVNSLLGFEDEVEILIINDGSTDRTIEIGEKLNSEYPKSIKLINKENGGHGSAINCGIKNATGQYIKVVDSDDWVDKIAYKEIINTLKKYNNGEIDMLISNFVYDKVGVKNKKIMSYSKYLPKNEIFTWDQISKFNIGTYILMHSVIYNIDILRNAKLKLPEHTFYVDNLFVYLPLPYVKNIYYLDVEFYHYFIGRDDQSVTESNMISRIDQQARVNKIMFDQFDLSKIENKPLADYMFKYLEIITLITNLFSIRGNNIELKNDLWKYFEESNFNQFDKLSKTVLCRLIRKNSKISMTTINTIYSMAQKFYGFN